MIVITVQKCKKDGKMEGFDVQRGKKYPIKDHTRWLIRCMKKIGNRPYRFIYFDETAA